MEDFEQANFTQGRISAPIRTKTQRITRVRFIRSVVKMLGVHMYGWMRVFALHFPHSFFFPFSRDSAWTDELREKQNLERERDRCKAQMNSFCAEARWQIAGARR